MGIRKMKLHSDAYLKDRTRAPEALRLKEYAIEIYVCGLTVIKVITTLWYIVNKRKNELLHKQVRNILHAPILWNSVPAPEMMDIWRLHNKI